jgi:hypothetical protein
MTKEQRIQAYVDAYEGFVKLLPPSKEALDFRPFADAWTIRENVVHVLDADLNGVLRLKKAFAQNGTPIVTFDEEKWTKSLSYEAFDVEPVVAVNRGLRALNATLLRAKLHEDWTQFFFSHPDAGLVSVDKWVDMHIAHVGFHVDLVQRNLKAFGSK